MRFGHPYILLGLLALPLLALLYIRRAGKQEVVVPSLVLWKAAAETGRRLGALDLPLLLALLCLAAAIVAASDPVVAVGARAAPRLLLILDRSASMASRTDSGRTRWEESLDAAGRVLDRLDGGEVWLVGLPLAAGPGLRELSPSEARAQLAELAPTDMPVDVVAELARCAGVANTRASAVIVVTDNPEPVPGRLGGKPVLVIARGGPSRNVAVDAFEVTRAEDGKLSVFVAVKNYSGAPRQVRLEVRADGATSSEATLPLAPGAGHPHTVGLPLTRAATVEVRLAVDDDLASDNRAVAVRSGPGVLRVALVGRANPFLTKALEQLPGVLVSQFRVAGEVTGDFGLRVYNGTVPGVLPAGEVVLIDPPGSVGPFEVTGAVTDKAGRRAHAARDSGLLKHVDVAALRFTRALTVRAPGAETLLGVTGGAAALMAWRDARTRAVLVGCDLKLSETNWPLLPSFPIFWANVIGDVTGRRGGADVPSYGLTGERVTVRGGADGGLSATGPGGAPVPVLPGRGARSSFLPVRAGVYTVSGGAGSLRFAANMMHPAESNNAGLVAEPSAEQQESVLAPGEGAGVSLWRYLGAAALALALGYWLTSGRAGG